MASSSCLRKSGSLKEAVCKRIKGRYEKTTDIQLAECYHFTIVASTNEICSLLLFVVPVTDDINCTGTKQ